MNELEDWRFSGARYLYSVESPIQIRNEVWCIKLQDEDDPDCFITVAHPEFDRAVTLAIQEWNRMLYGISEDESE